MVIRKYVQEIVAILIFAVVSFPNTSNSTDTTQPKTLSTEKANGKVTIPSSRTRNLAQTGDHNSFEFIPLTQDQIVALKGLADASIKKSGVSAEVDKKMYSFGLNTIAKQTVRKINNLNNKAVTVEAEGQVDFWGDCLYRVWKAEGIDAAAAARKIVLDTPEKRRMALVADQTFAFKRSKNLKINKAACIAQMESKP